MNVIIILIGLLCFTVLYGRGLEIYCEGREAVLRFSFPRRDIEVTLQIGNRYPFYSNQVGNDQLLESGLSKNQIKRFQVKQNATYSHYTVILNILNVSREDAGTYISLVYVDGEMITDLTKRIALVIEYPPGNPHCRYLSQPYIHAVILDTWDIIECSAAIGTMPGYIMCFQNNEALPIHGKLVKNSTTLSQRIWVKKGQLFSCCSSDFRGLVNASSCTAFQIGKIEGRPTTTSATYSTHGLPSYLNHDMSTSLSEYYTTSSMFDDVNDISTYKIFVTEVFILVGTYLAVLITTLLFIKLIQMERGIPENILADLKYYLELQQKKNVEAIACFSQQTRPYKIEDCINTKHSEHEAQQDIIQRIIVEYEQITRQEQRSTINQNFEIIQQNFTKAIQEITNEIKKVNQHSSQEMKSRRLRRLSLPGDHPSFIKNTLDTLKVVETLE